MIAWWNRLVGKCVSVTFALAFSACATEIESIFPTYGYVGLRDATRMEFFRYLERSYPNRRQLTDRDIRGFLHSNRFV